jgi:hypothetical protein
MRKCIGFMIPQKYRYLVFSVFSFFFKGFLLIEAAAYLLADLGFFLYILFIYFWRNQTKECLEGIHFVLYGVTARAIRFVQLYIHFREFNCNEIY